MLIECPGASAHVVRNGPTNRRWGGGTDGTAIATGHLLRETINPANSSGQSAADRTSKQSYNALGEVIRSYDPAGNRIDTTYSTVGRVVLREVHTFASGFDTSVKSIETTYDGMDLTRSSWRLTPRTAIPPNPPPTPRTERPSAAGAGLCGCWSWRGEV